MNSKTEILIVIASISLSGCFTFDYGPGRDSPGFGFYLGSLSSETYIPIDLSYFRIQYPDVYAYNYREYSIPHGYYHTHYNLKDGHEEGLQLRIAPRILKRFHLSLGMGISQLHYVDLDHSNATGWYYLRNRRTEYYSNSFIGAKLFVLGKPPTFTGHYSLFPLFMSDSPYGISGLVEWHTRRGLVFGLQWPF